MHLHDEFTPRGKFAPRGKFTPRGKRININGVLEVRNYKLRNICPFFPPSVRSQTMTSLQMHVHSLTRTPKSIPHSVNSSFR